MSESIWIKPVFGQSEIDPLEVEVTRPAKGGGTLAIVSRVSSFTSILSSTRGDTANLSTQAAAVRLPAAGAAAGAVNEATGAQAGADGLFVVFSPDQLSDEELEAALSGRLDSPGPVGVEDGVLLHLLRGGTFERSDGAFIGWNCMPPDPVMGLGIESPVLSRFRVVVTREDNSLPSGSATSVAVTRGIYSQTATPDWTQGTSGDYPIGVLKANALQGVGGGVGLEWVNGGVTYTRSGSVSTLSVSGSLTVNFGAPVSLSSTASWSSGELVVTVPA